MCCVAGSEDEDARTHRPQPANSLRSAQTKRNVLLGGTGCSRSLCRQHSPFGGTGGMEEQGRASARLDYSRATWRAHARWLLMIAVQTQTTELESTTLGKRARGGWRTRRRGTTGSVATDAWTRSVVNSRADVSEVETPVIRSMGMERGLVKSFFFFLLHERRGQGGTPTPFSTPTQTKVKPSLPCERQTCKTGFPRV